MKPKRPKPKLISKGKHADFYEVQGGEEKPYSVRYDKDRNEWNCSCIHGSSGFKGICWHIKSCQELRRKLKCQK